MLGRVLGVLASILDLIFCLVMLVVHKAGISVVDIPEAVHEVVVLLLGHFLGVELVCVPAAVSPDVMLELKYHLDTVSSDTKLRNFGLKLMDVLEFEGLVDPGLAKNEIVVGPLAIDAVLHEFFASIETPG